MQSFNEDEIRSANIRYFFPDGCQSPQIEYKEFDLKALFPDRKKPEPVVQEVKSVEVPKPKEKAAKSIPVDVETMLPGVPATTVRSINVLPLEPPREEPETSTQKVTEPITAKPITVPKTVKPTPAPTTLRPTPEPTTFKSIPEPTTLKTASKPTTLKPTIFKTTPEPTTVKLIPETTTSTPELTTAPEICEPISHAIPKPRIELSTNVLDPPPFKLADIKCSDTCCDDNRPQILLSRASPGSCCKGVSKIVIPIDMDVLGRMSTPEILEITNETSSIIMLQKLLKLAEKYKL